MIYILKRNLSIFFEKLKKVNFIYFIFFVFMIIVSYVTSRSLIFNESMKILGLTFSLEAYDLISTLGYSMFLLYFSYITIGTFSDDFKLSQDILFLRFSKKQWIIGKILSLLLILLLVRLFYYGLTFIIFRNLNIFSYIWIDYLFILFINIISILLLCAKLEFKVLIVLLFLFLNKFVFINISAIGISFGVIMLSICLVLYVVLIIYLIKNFTNICERLG